MVTLSLQYPQMPFLFLGFIAVFVFMASRIFKISNVSMALITALSFLLVFFYMIFESQLLQIVSHSFSDFHNNLTNLFSSSAFYKYELATHLSL